MSREQRTGGIVFHPHHGIKKGGGQGLKYVLKSSLLELCKGKGACTELEG